MHNQTQADTIAVYAKIHKRDRLPTDRIRASEARNTGSIPVGRTKLSQEVH